MVNNQKESVHFVGDAKVTIKQTSRVVKAFDMCVDELSTTFKLERFSGDVTVEAMKEAVLLNNGTLLQYQGKLFSLVSNNDQTFKSTLTSPAASRLSDVSNTLTTPNGKPKKVKISGGARLSDASRASTISNKSVASSLADVEDDLEDDFAHSQEEIDYDAMLAEMNDCAVDDSGLY